MRGERLDMETAKEKEEKHIGLANTSKSIPLQAYWLTSLHFMIRKRKHICELDLAI